MSFIPDADYRSFPLLVLRRTGGTRNPALPRLHSRPVIRLTVVSEDGQPDAEDLYEAALDALYAAVGDEFQSVTEVEGTTSTGSLYPDTYAVEGSIRLAVRAV